jgi:hypothetical protein
MTRLYRCPFSAFVSSELLTNEIPRGQRVGETKPFFSSIGPMVSRFANHDFAPVAWPAMGLMET